MLNVETCKWAGVEVLHKTKTESTNEDAKEAGEAGAAHGMVFWADSQSAGKGRRGRSWCSPEEGNLYFTILLRPRLSPEKASMLTLVMAYAVVQAIRLETGLEAFIKWPNDIVVHGRKVCGILSEMKLKGTDVDYCVIGVGVNVGQKAFAEEICDRATSLELELEQSVVAENRQGRAGTSTLQQERGCGLPRKNIEELEVSMLLKKILWCFEQEYELFEKAQNLAPIQENYNKLLINMDRQVCVLDPKGQYEGIARGITRTGELLVETKPGQCVKVYAGEVSVRGIYGYV